MPRLGLSKHIALDFSALNNAFRVPRILAFIIGTIFSVLLRLLIIACLDGLLSCYDSSPEQVDAALLSFLSF